MTDFHAFVQNYPHRDALVAEANEKNTAGLFGPLAAAGITRLHVSLTDWCEGDEDGGITAYAGKAKAALPRRSVESHSLRAGSGVLQTALQPIGSVVIQLCYDFLAYKYLTRSADGSTCEEFEIDVATRSVNPVFNTGFAPSTRFRHAA
jgi:hypothetical protein